MTLVVDIQSRMITPMVVNMLRQDFSLIPHIPGTIMKRTLSEIDPANGRQRQREVIMHCPPAITFPAMGVVKGLPEGVLKNPTIASLMDSTNGRRPRLLVCRRYDSDEKLSPPDSPSPARARSKKNKVSNK